MSASKREGVAIPRLDALVGRQPIFDKNARVRAYELLYRSDPTQNHASFRNADQATSSVILNTFLEIGLERVVGKLPAYVNFTRSFLLGHYPIPERSDRIVVEVLEDIEPDADIVRAVAEYSAKGYTIALDDFQYTDAHRPLLEIANVIKLDVLALGRDGIRRQMDLLSPFEVKFLAEKVDNLEDYTFCEEAGCELFQGFYLCKPQIVKGQRIPTNRLALLRLLSKIYDPNARIAEIEQLVTQDVALSFRLVRCVNSALYARPYKIESIRQAITMLGLNQLASWVSLMSLSGLGDKPSELIVTAMVRAKMCELLAKELGTVSPDTAFTIGMFSLLDALLDMPMVDILQNVHLSDDVSQALVLGTGPGGALLQGVRAQEAGNWEGVRPLGLQPQIIGMAWLDALTWADQAVRVVAVSLPPGAGSVRSA